MTCVGVAECKPAWVANNEPAWAAEYKPTWAAVAPPVEEDEDHSCTEMHLGEGAAEKATRKIIV